MAITKVTSDLLNSTALTSKAFGTSSIMIGDDEQQANEVTIKNMVTSDQARIKQIDLVEYPYGTLSNDYDDTVSMIAAMDHVIALQTTAIHVAGSLGVSCDVLVPKTSQWRYGEEGEDFPWAESVRIVRQTKRGEWGDVIERLTAEMPQKFGEKENGKPMVSTNGSGKLLEESRQIG